MAGLLCPQFICVLNVTVSFLLKAEPHTVVVSFPVAMIKSDKSNLRRKGMFELPVAGSSPSNQGKQQEFEEGVSLCP